MTGLRHGLKDKLDGFDPIGEESASLYWIIVHDEFYIGSVFGLFV